MLSSPSRWRTRRRGMLSLTLLMRALWHPNTLRLSSNSYWWAIVSMLMKQWLLFLLLGVLPLLLVILLIWWRWSIATCGRHPSSSVHRHRSTPSLTPRVQAGEGEEDHEDEEGNTSSQNPATPPGPLTFAADSSSVKVAYRADVTVQRKERISG